jgi:hypothetical protein
MTEGRPYFKVRASVFSLHFKHLGHSCPYARMPEQNYSAPAGVVSDHSGDDGDCHGDDGDDGVQPHLHPTVISI